VSQRFYIPKIKSGRWGWPGKPILPQMSICVLFSENGVINKQKFLLMKLLLKLLCLGRVILGSIWSADWSPGSTGIVWWNNEIFHE
jgi:hypothetical protein